MKRLLIAPCLAIAVAFPASAELEREAFVRAGASVLRIEVPRRGGGYGIGSGVAVAREVVITNCHVTRDAHEILVVVRGGTRLPAAAQASDTAHDLCLLQVPGLTTSAVPLGRSGDLNVGQALTALGFTGGGGMQSSIGEVVQLHRHDGARVIQSSNRFNSGASGGGLFDDQGALVGVLTFRMRGVDAHYFAAPAEWVRDLIDAAQRGAFDPVMPLPRRPVAYWEATGEERPRFLQAAALEHSMRWDDLQAHAREWLRAEPDDAEPWFVLGMALVRLGRMPEGRQALECALRLDAGNRAARAWMARTLPPATAWLDGPAPCEAS